MSIKPDFTPGPCIWCGDWVECGRELAGSTNPKDPAWHVDGNFGCCGSPFTDEDGVGDHARSYDLVRLEERVTELTEMLDRIFRCIDTIRRSP